MAIVESAGAAKCKFYVLVAICIFALINLLVSIVAPTVKHDCFESWQCTASYVSDVAINFLMYATGPLIVFIFTFYGFTLSHPIGMALGLGCAILAMFLAYYTFTAYQIKKNALLSIALMAIWFLSAHLLAYLAALALGHSF